MSRRYNLKPPAPDLVRFEQLPDFENLTYRQLDYWMRTGILPLSTALPGSGNRRWYTRLDVDRLCVLDRLLPELNFHGVGTHTPTGIITAIWDHLSTQPWAATLLVQKTDTGWTTTNVNADRVFLVIPITEAPNNL